MSCDVQALIYEVESILFTIISQNVLLFVWITKFDDPPSNEIADVTSGICEGKTYWGDPKTWTHSFLVFVLEIKSVFKSVLSFFIIYLACCLKGSKRFIYQPLTHEREASFRPFLHHLVSSSISCLFEWGERGETNSFTVLNSRKSSIKEKKKFRHFS